MLLSTISRDFQYGKFCDFPEVDIAYDPSIPRFTDRSFTIDASDDGTVYFDLGVDLVSQNISGILEFLPYR